MPVHNQQVRPTILVIIERGNAEAILTGCVLESAGLTDIFKLPVTQVVVEDVGDALVRGYSINGFGRHTLVEVT